VIAFKYSTSSSSSRSPDGPLCRPMTLKISVLHRDESGIALASSLTRLSQVRRGRPGGLVQLVDGFLPHDCSPSRARPCLLGLQGPNVHHTECWDWSWCCNKPVNDLVIKSMILLTTRSHLPTSQPQITSLHYLVTAIHVVEWSGVKAITTQSQVQHHTLTITSPSDTLYIL